jgi:crossover junction endodeoxyribonuclease RuvC
MLILGIDPGTVAIGLGLIEYQNKKATLVAFDCLTTNPEETTAQRLGDLYQKLTKFIKKYKPEIITVEDIFFFKNLKTVIKVSQARGVILLAASQHKITVYEYTPLQIKQALTGYGRAEKKQVQHMVKAVLGLKEIPQPDDAADALAAAICCAHSLR